MVETVTAYKAATGKLYTTEKQALEAEGVEDAVKRLLLLKIAELTRLCPDHWRGFGSNESDARTNCEWWLRDNYVRLKEILNG